jgi:flavin reductase (DIM6/NTAB) family NADH-FMN oxidoreductase RutF
MILVKMIYLLTLKDTIMYLSVDELSTQAIYKILVSGIIPRPIAWVSTQNAQGTQNLAPYSFFTVASVNPPILAISHIAPRSGDEKDTLANLAAVPECVVHIVSSNQAEAMNATAAALANELSEFEQANIQATPSQQVQPQSVAASGVRFECRLRTVNHLSNLPAGGQLILLDVIGIYIEDGWLNPAGLVDANLLDAIGKLGADDYTHCRDRFTLVRPG